LYAAVEVLRFLAGQGERFFNQYILAEIKAGGHPGVVVAGRGADADGGGFREPGNVFSVGRRGDMGDVELGGDGPGAGFVGINNADDLGVGQAAQSGQVAGLADPPGADHGDLHGHGISRRV